MWLCKCDCGNEKVVRSDSLKNGAIRSCGCLMKESIAKRRFKDLTGKKFGRWTVLEQAENQNNCVMWKCQCECGTVRNVFATSLLNGKSKSCGCLKNEVASKLNLIDLTGKRIGMLTVLKRVEDYISTLQSGSISTQWLCKCDCGNEVIKRGRSLRNGAQSCGCVEMPRGEFFIKEILEQNNVNYFPQYKFDDCRDVLPLPFDFYLPDKNICIEYDGIQHYKPVEYFGGKTHYISQKRHDEIKNEYCKDNGIRLLRVPYFYTTKQIEKSVINILNP